MAAVYPVFRDPFGHDTVKAALKSLAHKGFVRHAGYETSSAFPTRLDARRETEPRENRIRQLAQFVALDGIADREHSICWQSIEPS